MICVVTSAAQPNLEGAAVRACKYLEASKTRMVTQRSDLLGDMDSTPEKASISRDCFYWHFLLSCLFVLNWGLISHRSIYICSTFPFHSVIDATFCIFSTQVSQPGGLASFAKPIFSKSTWCRWVMKIMGDLPPTTSLFLLRTHIQMC